MRKIALTFVALFFLFITFLAFIFEKNDENEIFDSLVGYNECGELESYDCKMEPQNDQYTEWEDLGSVPNVGWNYSVRWHTQTQNYFICDGNQVTMVTKKHSRYQAKMLAGVKTLRTDIEEINRNVVYGVICPLCRR